MHMQDVFDVIREERQYQDQHATPFENPNPFLPSNHIRLELSVGETILAMEHNLEKAKRAWYHNDEPDYRNAMNYIRKVAALSVLAGETFGMPRRSHN